MMSRYLVCAMNAKLVRISLLVIFSLCWCKAGFVFSAPLDIKSQHRQMMMDSIKGCDSKMVGRLLVTPYVDPNDELSPSVLVAPGSHDQVIDSYLLRVVSSSCTDAAKIDMLGVLISSGADIDISHGDTRPLAASLALRAPSSPYKIASFLLDNGASAFTANSSFEGGFYTLLWRISNWAGRPDSLLSSDEAAILVGRFVKSVKANNFLGGDHLEDRNFRGQTVFLNAVSLVADIPILEALLNAGAEGGEKTPAGFSAIDILREHVSGGVCERIDISVSYGKLPGEYRARRENIINFLRAKGFPEQDLPPYGPPCPE